MSFTDDRKLAWGYGSAVPADTKAAWGARLILTRDSRTFGGDMLPDRQSGFSVTDEDSRLLHDRLNHHKPWKKPLADLIRSGAVRADVGNEVIVYEDELVKVVGNSNASFGYFYIAGWLK